MLLNYPSHLHKSTCKPSSQSSVRFSASENTRSDTNDRSLLHGKERLKARLEAFGTLNDLSDYVEGATAWTFELKTPETFADGFHISHINLHQSPKGFELSLLYNLINPKAALNKKTSFLAEDLSHIDAQKLYVINTFHDLNRAKKAYINLLEDFVSKEPKNYLKHLPKQNFQSINTQLLRQLIVNTINPILYKTGLKK